MNKLKLLALQLSDTLEAEGERRRVDMTAIYRDEMHQMLKHDELVNVQVHGEPGSGKSTVMAAEVYAGNRHLEKETRIGYIHPNQLTYLHFMKGMTEERLDIFIGIDEYEDLGDTGYNATVDAAFQDHISNLHRANYVHKVACAPKDTIDKNANIILEILTADKQERYTRCLLYYKLFAGGADRQVLLGYVDIDVSLALDAPFYQEYYTRKMHRLAMFSRYGIAHERHIFFAKSVLHAYDELRELAKHNKVDRGLIELQVDISSREYRLLNSILGATKLSQDVQALLSYVHHQEQEKKRVQKAKQAGQLALIEVHQRLLTRLGEQLEKALTYWRNAAELEALYFAAEGRDGTTE